MIYQLHIRLLETNPPIWRRIQVSGNIKLYRLAMLILRAMGWDNSHLCEFEIDGKKYGYKDLDEYDDGVLEFKKFVVSKVLADKVKKFMLCMILEMTGSTKLLWRIFFLKLLA